MFRMIVYATVLLFFGIMLYVSSSAFLRDSSQIAMDVSELFLMWKEKGR